MVTRLVNCQLHFLGFVRDNVYTSQFPQSIAELFGRILVMTVAIETAIAQHVWEELQHYLDLGCPTFSPWAAYGPPVCVTEPVATFVNCICPLEIAQ